VWNTSALTFVGWATTLGLALAAIYVLALVIGGALTSPGTFWNKTLNTLDYALYADTRRQLTAEGNQGLSGSALMGVVFAAGWTPCIGPTLGLAFTLAANGGDIGQAATLMTAYSLGLGIPFLITALAMDSAQGALRGLKRHMGTIKTVSGAFLVFIGVLIASGRLQEISRQFSVEFGDFSYRIEECTVGLFDGDINAGQYGTCIGSEGGVAALSGATAGAAGIETTSDSSTSATDTSVASAEAVEVGLAVGNRAPEFTTTTIDGEPVALSDFEGDVVLLNFWFTTCEPCRVEMPEFQRAFDAHADDGFTVVAVNREEGPETIRTFAEDYDLDFPLLLDEEGDIQFQYGVTGYPSTFILDRDGVIVWRNFGPISVETIQERIDEVLS
jgi:peroxiredoxin